MLFLLCGCKEVTTTLPNARNSDGTVYFAPLCVEHKDEVWAMKVTLIRVPRNAPILDTPVGKADGLYDPNYKFIFIRDDLAEWVKLDTEFHERCHAWLDMTTGSYIFHR